MSLALKDIERDKLSPMMRQFADIKDQYPDCLVLFRLGDFYETFFEDAETAARVLEIALTSRDCGLDERAPMAGVPHHALDQYLHRLLDQGFKLALVEQMEDPQLAKGLVKRQVVRVVTPGTQTDQAALDANKNHYLLAIKDEGPGFGIAVIELISGRFLGTAILGGSTKDKLLAELARFDPAEVLISETFAEDTFHTKYLRDRYVCTLVPASTFELPSEHEAPVTADFQTAEQEEGILEADSSTKKPYRSYLPDEALSDPQNLTSQAGMSILRYLIHTQFRIPKHVERLERYDAGGQLQLDEAARRNLELFETVRERRQKGSLFWALDRCVTSMGRRLLRRWLDRPLSSVPAIVERQDAIEDFVNDFILRKSLRDRLAATYDLERLAGKLDLGQGNARDLLSLARSLRQLDPIRDLLPKDAPADLIQQLRAQIDPMDDLASEIEAALIDPAPISITDGGLINYGYSEELDEIKEMAENGQSKLMELEAREREATGIKNLKIGFNRVFAYYLEVTKSQADKVPDHYIRKQTLVNAERYFTDELKIMEDKILGSQARLVELEYELFCQLRRKAALVSHIIRRNAEAIAQLDVLSGLAELASRENYIRPSINTSHDLIIEQGRHPVVEQSLGKGAFVANDVSMAGKDERLILLTGPNMSGKSTYMRQSALIVIMAQMGSFVPASRAEIGIVQQIFTRIGASDDLGSGESTFMVEMMEVASILREAEDRALLILDEIGRGTSTYDGLAIAWSLIEEILLGMPKGVRTFFATHYHELTELEGQLPGLVNRYVQVQELEDEVIFLHRIAAGAANRSYGIEVAQLAGVRPSVVFRAQERLALLEQQKSGPGKSRPQAKILEGQMDLFSSAFSLRQTDEIFEDLRTLNVDELRPIDAWHKLDELSRKAHESERNV